MPYSTGVHALRDGWMLLQSAQLIPPAPGTEHLNAYLDYEFVFERRVDRLTGPPVLVNFLRPRVRKKFTRTSYMTSEAGRTTLGSGAWATLSSLPPP